jgi:formylglycine-generating enzyme required for sulfatase activity
VVLYELITGRKPYSADTPAAVAIMQATEPLAPPSGLVQGIPNAVEKVLYKALARDPQDRYENMEEFVLALRGLLVDADTAEPVLPIMESGKQESNYVPEASADNESVTRDTLDETPVEEMNVKSKAQRGLPNWVLWAGIGVILLAFLGFFVVEMGKGGEELLAMPTTETATATVTPIVTKTSIATITTTITPAPELILGIGSTMINEKDGAEMVYVPAGEFLMGSEDAEADSDEGPEHTVYLDAYWVYKYEVINGQYHQCIKDGTCSGDLSSYPENDYPAVYISWYEANDYCEWAGGRLPTEAEWEKAARGDDGRTYPWGEENPNCSLANFYVCAGAPMPVGSFPNGVSPYGVLDMSGNVWEWVADWYDVDYYQTSSAQNPTGPANGENRVIRGGYWILDGWYLRVTDRIGVSPGESLLPRGFRCVISAVP